MITIRSGVMTIPEEDRFIGYTGDDRYTEVELLIKNFVVPNSNYTLCLRFDDGTERVIPLNGSQILSDVLLVWNVRREELHSAGIVTAQMRIDCGDGRVIHSTRDYFLVAGEEGSDEGEDDYVTRPELEQRLDSVRSRLPYVNADGAFLVTDSGDVRIAEADDVYTKGEVDGMIGDLEDALARV